VNPRNALALALMVATAGVGHQAAASLLDAPRPRRPKAPDAARQAAAEAKRQRRAERNKALEARP